MRHKPTPEQAKAMIQAIINILKSSQHRCGQCDSCFRRGSVDALAVKVLEVERVGV